MKAQIFYFSKKAFLEEPPATFFMYAKVTKKMLDETGLKNFVQVDTHEEKTPLLKSFVNIFSNRSKKEFAERLFAVYNDGTEGGNPLGTPEGQQKIRSIGVSHTSMSINDFVVIDGDVLIVDGSGFLDIGKHSALNEVVQN